MLNDNFKQKISALNILVIGDVMLDRYIMGDANRLSPEAPVPVVNVNNVNDVLGGAANVANNLASINVNVSLCGLLGADGYMYHKIKNLMTIAGINHKGVVVDQDRQTTIKTRIMSDNQQIVRYDVEDTHEYTDGKLLDYIERFNDLDTIIVSDYGKGVITDKLMEIISVWNGGVPIIVDPNVNNYDYYKNRIHTITPNISEALFFHNDKNLDKVGAKMVDYLNCENAIITKGKDGLCIYGSNYKRRSIKASNIKQVFDVSGAGDTLTSALAVGIALGMDVYDSALMANRAAGEVVGDVGTSVIGDRLWKN